MLASSASKFKRGDNNRVVTSNVKRKVSSDVIDLTSDDEEEDSTFEFISKRKKRSTEELPQITPITVQWEDTIDNEAEIIPENSNKIRPSNSSTTKSHEEEKSNYSETKNRGEKTKPLRVNTTTSIISKLKQIQTPPKLLNSSDNSNAVSKQRTPKNLTGKLALPSNENCKSKISPILFTELSRTPHNNDVIIENSNKNAVPSDSNRKLKYSVKNMTSEKKPINAHATLHELWSLKHAPRTSDELVVHAAKVRAVRSLFESAKLGRGPKALVITGPSGSAKSATIDTLCRDMAISLERWSMPAASAENCLSDLTAFLTRERYNHVLDKVLPSNELKVLTVEEWPILESFQLKETFRNLIRIYLQRDQRNTRTKTCLVMSITDTTIGGNVSATQLFGDLLTGGEFQGEISLVRFNPVAPSYIVKCLQRIAHEEHIDHVLTKNTLKSIADTAQGDLRAAINSLQFFSSKYRPDHALAAVVNKKGKKRKLTMRATGSDDESAVSGRDQTLSLFHALGKILYNKRT